MFISTIKNSSFKDIEDNLNSTSGFSNVCISKNYFFATFNPSALTVSTSGLSDEAMDLSSFYLNMKITFKSRSTSQTAQYPKTVKPYHGSSKMQTRQQGFSLPQPR